MQEIEIRHCASCRPIERDEAKYQTDIIATGCTWRANLTVDYALQNAPNVGQTYFVTLHQPVKFSLNMALWLFYDCPLAHYNGYETEAEIEAAKFCFGEITNIIARDELGATVEFIVTKTLAFQDILETKKATELPQFWRDVSARAGCRRRWPLLRSVGRGRV